MKPLINSVLFRKTAQKTIRLLTCYAFIYSCDTASAAFLNTGYTARQHGLANASTTLADEGAVFSNPACLAKIKGTVFSANYSSLLSGLTDNSQASDGTLIIGKPLSRGAIGLGYFSRSLDSLYSESSLNLSYGIKLFRTVSAGINITGFKIEYGVNEYSENNPYFTEHGRMKSFFAADCGLLLDLYDGFDAAFTFKRVNCPDTGLGEETLLPSEFTAGCGCRGKDVSFLLEGSFSALRNTASAGIEKSFFDGSLALRGGFTCGNYSFSAVAIGFGWKTNIFTLDYAFNCGLGELSAPGSQYITLKYYL